MLISKFGESSKKSYQNSPIMIVFIQDTLSKVSVTCKQIKDTQKYLPKTLKIWAIHLTDLLKKRRTNNSLHLISTIVHSMSGSSYLQLENTRQTR